MIEFTPAKIKPDKPGHYLTVSEMNWYHGGCFDTDKDGLSLSYRVAYYSDVVGWNDPFLLAWAELPDFPEIYKSVNRKTMAERAKNLKPCYGTTCRFE